MVNNDKKISPEEIEPIKTIFKKSSQKSAEVLKSIDSRLEKIESELAMLSLSSTQQLRGLENRIIDVLTSLSVDIDQMIVQGAVRTPNQVRFNG